MACCDEAAPPLGQVWMVLAWPRPPRREGNHDAMLRRYAAMRCAVERRGEEGRGGRRRRRSRSALYKTSTQPQEGWEKPKTTKERRDQADGGRRSLDEGVPERRMDWKDVCMRINEEGGK